jgi:hypothetical protein
MDVGAEDFGPWFVDVFVNGRRVDKKGPPRQVYPPHASIPRSKATPGGVLSIVFFHTYVPHNGFAVT